MPKLIRMRFLDGHGHTIKRADCGCGGTADAAALDHRPAPSSLTFGRSGAEISGLARPYVAPTSNKLKGFNARARAVWGR